MIRVGTASWTDKSLIACGRFYPPGVNTAEARLRYYATRFPLVEVDASFYAMPTSANARLWVDRTPDDFTFHIKAFRLLTGHGTHRDSFPKDLRAALPVRAKWRPAAPPPSPESRAGDRVGDRAGDRAGDRDIERARARGGAEDVWYYRDVPAVVRDALWSRYLDAIAPLREAGKLGAVHFQFAPWIKCDPRGQAHLDDCAERMHGHPVSIEFRHRSWFDGPARPATLAHLRQRGLINVVVDAPQGADNTVPAIWDTTSADLAVVRLHGRNSDTWNIRGATASSSRFQYDYSDRELVTLAISIKALSERVSNTHVVFNNNWEDQGQRNASRLIQINNLDWSNL